MKRWILRFGKTPPRLLLLYKYRYDNALVFESECQCPVAKVRPYLARSRFLARRPVRVPAVNPRKLSVSGVPGPLFLLGNLSRMFLFSFYFSLEKRRTNNRRTVLCTSQTASLSQNLTVKKYLLKIIQRNKKIVLYDKIIVIVNCKSHAFYAIKVPSLDWIYTNICVHWGR